MVTFLVRIYGNEPPKVSTLMRYALVWNPSLQICEEVPGIATPPQSPPDSTMPTTHSSSVPVMPPHTASSTPQRNTSPCAQQELQQQKATPVNTNETINKGSCSLVDVVHCCWYRVLVWLCIWRGCSTQDYSCWPFAGINTVIQVLKSGELVCLPVPTQVSATSKVNTLLIYRLYINPWMYMFIIRTLGYFSSSAPESSKTRIIGKRFFCTQETPPRLQHSRHGSAFTCILCCNLHYYT